MQLDVKEHFMITSMVGPMAPKKSFRSEVGENVCRA